MRTSRVGVGVTDDLTEVVHRRGITALNDLIRFTARGGQDAQIGHGVLDIASGRPRLTRKAGIWR